MSGTISAMNMWLGHYLNTPLRQLGRDVERTSRRLTYNEAGFEKTLTKETLIRIAMAIRALVLTPPAVIGGALGASCFLASYLLDSSRIEIHDFGAKTVVKTKKSFLRLLSLNVCFQEGPGAPFAGGVVPPHEPTKGYPSRIAAIADWVAKRKHAPDIFLGQECTAHAAQDEFVAEMKKHGYTFFIVDRSPHPVLMNSGLLVASRYKLQDSTFIHLPGIDCHAVARGAIGFSISSRHNKPLLHVINTHLTAQAGVQGNEKRYLQLKRHIMPHFEKQTIATLLIGDLNFNTASAKAKEESGLQGYTNICEGHKTYTSKSIAHLRYPLRFLGKPFMPPPVETDNIDVIIPNAKVKSLRNCKIEKVKIDEQFLTDHYAVSASVAI